jgi:hypothetical protein
LSDDINTPFDEISPIMSHDGKKLFFSSKGHKTIGGYDIFVSHLVNGKWTKPKNLGYPLNTTDDDVFYFPIGDGSAGYMSRVMPQSFGGTDIYFVQFEQGADEQNQFDINQSNSSITLDKIGHKPNSSVRPNFLTIP